jgi:hypothetical protein
MKSDPRYTSESVFNTFPWPQSPSSSAVKAVADAALALTELRKSMAQKGFGLRALYRTLDLPGASPLKDAHAKLDDAVMSAYGFSKKKDILQQILSLNAEVADAINEGKSVGGPGIPSGFAAPASLVSNDAFGKT